MCGFVPEDGRAIAAGQDITPHFEKTIYDNF
jgi:hypothetical protein